MGRSLSKDCCVRVQVRSVVLRLVSMTSQVEPTTMNYSCMRYLEVLHLLDGNPINTFFAGHFLGGSQGVQGILGPTGPWLNYFS